MVQSLQSGHNTLNHYEPYLGATTHLRWL